ncbi:EcsC family protein [Clostridium sp. YIM B02555]|uniref:EcsC family protein n=1 Tax=Clostridium sp. YIM B02555 TaxID=2911968 RepID=UPI001EEE4B23|nr:EcsC family protein [Clostridium sp. YIM B02555]
MDNKEGKNKFELALTIALKLPGVKVNRNSFLKKELRNYVSKEKINQAIKSNTIEAEIDLHVLDKVAKKIISKRTTKTARTSFFTGLLGGFAMAATIPADTLQFFRVALKIAQELAYLYGFEDLWEDDNADSEKVRKELILFLGAMFGVGGANATLRLISTNIAKQELKKLPRQVLIRNIYFPVIKKIAETIGLKMTKDTFTKGGTKAIPILGGVISGGLTYISMKSMGNRLRLALESSVNKNYTEEDLKNDIQDLERVTGETIDIQCEAVDTESNDIIEEASIGKEEGF